MTLTDLEQFTAAVHCDLDGEATDLELAMLQRPENLVRWVRTLHRIRRDAGDAIADERARLIGHKPRVGQSHSNAYLELKEDVDAQVAKLNRVAARCRSRADEVADLIGSTGVTVVTVGQWITTLISIENLLTDGKADNAHALVTAVIDQWETHEAAARAVAS